MKSENIPIGSANIQETLLDSLRLKITDQCQWQCAFCHNEGDIATTDLTWGPALEDTIKALKQVLPIKEVHFTGGEPTMDRGMALVAAGLTAMGLEVKTTTNGQFSEAQLDALIRSGLRSFNFSIHTLNPERFLQHQQGRGLWWQSKEKKGSKELPESELKRIPMDKIQWAQQQLDKQQKMIMAVKERGVDVKINTVISSEDDIANAEEIFTWAKERQIPVRLLNDLSGGMSSIEAIRKFIGQTGAVEVLRKVQRGTSACSTVYRLPESHYEFAFKQIRNFKLESMCQSCPRASDGSCEEEFYGIRLQRSKDGNFYVVLCIQEGNKDTQMSLPDFLKSPQLKEIQEYLK